MTRTGAAAFGAAGALGSPGVAQADAKRGGGHGSAADPLLADGALQKAVVSDPSERLPAVPFHGRHQAGITSSPPPAACFVVFNVTAGTRGELVDTLQTLTRRARFLTQGGVPANLGPVAPPSDSGTLGPVVPPDGLTITVGFGASLFENPAFGLADKKPKRLSEMTSFPNDNLQPDITGGDILLQICAGQPDTAIHALRDIAKHTRAGMQIAYRMDGFQAPQRPSGVPRNHFGHMDGIANPNVTYPYVANRLLWVTDQTDEPAWARGGTYHVFRIIRMFIEFWDRVALNEQQTMIGRYRASGAMLGTNSITDVLDFAKDPQGKIMPLTAHIRLSNPRTKATQDSRIFRRGYNYDNGIDL
ncbi:MAG TPA: Dyp-type peroxidase, partial [Solirubrobacteraceae bacterium]|nr:Dyp-type peroxidase [Solirubrobacteraceae bacterium]